MMTYDERRYTISQAYTMLIDDSLSEEAREELKDILLQTELYVYTKFPNRDEYFINMNDQIIRLKYMLDSKSIPPKSLKELKAMESRSGLNYIINENMHKMKKRNSAERSSPNKKNTQVEKDYKRAGSIEELDKYNRIQQKRSISSDYVRYPENTAYYEASSLKRNLPNQIERLPNNQTSHMQANDQIPSIQAYEATQIRNNQDQRSRNGEVYQPPFNSNYIHSGGNYAWQKEYPSINEDEYFINNNSSQNISYRNLKYAQQNSLFSQTFKKTATSNNQKNNISICQYPERGFSTNNNPELRQKQLTEMMQQNKTNNLGETAQRYDNVNGVNSHQYFRDDNQEKVEYDSQISNNPNNSQYYPFLNPTRPNYFNKNFQNNFTLDELNGLKSSQQPVNNLKMSENAKEYYNPNTSAANKYPNPNSLLSNSSLYQSNSNKSPASQIANLNQIAAVKESLMGYKSIKRVTDSSRRPEQDFYAKINSPNQTINMKYESILSMYNRKGNNSGLEANCDSNSYLMQNMAHEQNEMQKGVKIDRSMSDPNLEQQDQYNNPIRNRIRRIFHNNQNNAAIQERATQNSLFNSKIGTAFKYSCQIKNDIQVDRYSTSPHLDSSSLNGNSNNFNKHPNVHNGYTSAYYNGYSSVNDGYTSIENNCRIHENMKFPSNDSTNSVLNTYEKDLFLNRENYKKSRLEDEIQNPSKEYYERNVHAQKFYETALKKNKQKSPSTLEVQMNTKRVQLDVTGSISKIEEEKACNEVNFRREVMNEDELNEKEIPEDFLNVENKLTPNMKDENSQSNNKDVANMNFDNNKSSSPINNKNELEDVDLKENNTIQYRSIITSLENIECKNLNNLVNELFRDKEEVQRVSSVSNLLEFIKNVQRNFIIFSEKTEDKIQYKIFKFIMLTLNRELENNEKGKFFLSQQVLDEIYNLLKIKKKFIDSRIDYSKINTQKFQEMQDKMVGNVLDRFLERVKYEDDYKFVYDEPNESISD